MLIKDFTKITQIVPKNIKYNFYIFIFFLLISSAFELVSISALIPIAEILLNGTCGLLFDLKSPNSIYKAVEKVLNHPEDTFIRVSAAYNHALNNFTKIKMADLYFQELFKNKISK